MSENVISFAGPDDALIARLEEELRNPLERAEIWTITPGLCRHVLAEHHRRNRSESGPKIKRYGSVMTTDSWALNGESVKFTKAGQLGDGQNRFKACIRSGRPFTTFVCFGIADEHFFTMDRGKARTAADVLHLEGVAHSDLIASAMRWAELIITNSTKRRSSYEPSEILRMWRDKVNGHSGVEDFVDEARQIYRITGQPRTVVMAMLYLFDKVDPDFAPDFAAAWGNSSRDPVRWSAIKSMEDMFAEAKAQRYRTRNQRTAHAFIASTVSGRVHDVVRAAVIIKCFIKSRAGERGLRGSLLWRLEEPFPQIPGLVYRPPLGQPTVVSMP